MTKILIIDTPALENRGGMATIIGALTSLRDSFPQAQVTLLCQHPEKDWEMLNQICQRFNVKLGRHPWLREHNSKILTLAHSGLPILWTIFQCFFGRLKRKMGMHPRDIFNDNDVILSLCIDTLHDHYGILFPLWTLANQMLGVLSGRPVVVWGAGIGHFHRKLTQSLARFVLDRVKMILSRDDASKNYVKKLGITHPRIETTADHAFMMEPSSSQRIQEILNSERVINNNHPLIAVAPSNQIHWYAFPDISDRARKYQIHLGVIVKIVDFLIDKLNADILLLSHALTPGQDDRVISQDIYRSIKSNSRAKIMNGYMADEYKGIISRCDMLVGERMHPTIASTSMGVPTVAVVYGEKTYGILGSMMGLNDYLIEISKYSPEQLRQKLEVTINKVWQEREAIHRMLKEKAVTAREQARLNGSLIKTLVPSP